MALDPHEYTVGWICAVQVELTAAMVMLDNRHDPPVSKSKNDSNAYTLGQIKDHNIVIACLGQGQYGVASAATAATNMLNTFEAIRIILMVGIGGGAPSATHDVRLGDVVVAKPSGREGGVVAYEQGKAIQDKKFEFSGHLNSPPTVLLTALTRLGALHEINGNGIAEMVSDVIGKNARLRKRYGRPEEDRLYEASYRHESDQPCKISCNEMPSRLVSRGARDPEEDLSVVHVGTIASADKLMKDAIIRDELAANYGVLCFEMEAAGLMNNAPCLVIRGISDYSDTHKNDMWQGYAAAAAAAYAKQLLESIPGYDIMGSRRAKDEMQKMEEMQKSVQENTMTTRELAQRFSVKEESEIKQRLIDNLSPLNCLGWQKELYHDYMPTTQSLLESEEYKYWSNGEPWQLRLYGPEGSGKTMLSACVVENLQRSSDGKNKAVVYLSPNDPQKLTSNILTPRNLVGSLLKQFIQQSRTSHVSENIKLIYTKHWEEELNTCVLCEILKAEIITFERVYLIIDALDQYPENSQQFLTNDLMCMDQERMSVMVFSRELEVDTATEIRCNICKSRNLKMYVQCKVCIDFDICRRCREKGKSCEKTHEMVQADKVYFGIWTAQNDIEKYVHRELENELKRGKTSYWDTRKNKNAPGSSVFFNTIQDDPHLVRDIPIIIANKSRRNFRLAKVFLDSIRQQFNKYAIMKALHSLPDGLHDHYKQQLEGLMAKKYGKYGHIGLKVLSLVALARRHIGFAELQHALVMILEPDLSAFFHSMVIGRKDILAMTHQLVTVDNDEIADVKLYHPTFQIYFDESKPDDLPKDIVVQAQLARACLKYLKFDPVSRPCKSLQGFEARRKEYPFIAYASQYWGDHVSLASDPGTELMAIDFLKHPERIAACAQAAWLTSISRDTNWADQGGASALHLCAWFGLTSVISAVHKDYLNIDVREPIHRRTPLMYACKRGHINVVTQLLALSASVNVSSVQGATPLFEAIAENHEDVVALLLTRRELQINTTNPEQFGRTALMFAVRLGHVNITHKLLSFPSIDLNKQDEDGYTSLSIAITKGQSDIVSMLLGQKGIDVNLVTHVAGHSALTLAASQNNGKVVRLLLERGADLNYRDNDGGLSAISRAVGYGSVSSFTVMLEYHVDIRTVDDDGRSLLHWSCAGGQVDFIPILIENGLHINGQDKYGSTPLHEASRHGKTGAANILLKLGADHTIKDKDGNLAIDVAWQYWKTDITNLLTFKDSSEKGRAMVTVGDEERPIWALVKAGRMDLIERVVVAGTVDFSQTETGTNKNALHFATHAQNVNILDFLLQKGVIPINGTDHHQRTPLHVAALNNKVKATETLLTEPSIELNCKDRWGDTPLSTALHRKNFEVAVLLIEARANTNSNTVDRNLQALFFKAVELGSVHAVRALIKKGADVLERDEDGEMALHIALRRKDDEMIQLLRSSSDFLRDESNGGNGVKRQNDSTAEDAPLPRRRRTED